MRRPSIFSRRTTMEVKMTPMIDVVFLLLVFFVWTASFHVPEFYVSSDLTQMVGSTASDVPPPAPEDFDFPDLVIRIQWDEADARPIYIFGEVDAVETATILSLSELHATLAGIQRRSEPLILHPDDNVPLGDVMDVFDAADSLNFTEISFAAAAESL